MRRDPLPYLILPVAALLAVFPLILQGPSCGHDFDFHILNWLEAASQFRHGNLHPHWAFSPAWNAGEPRFVFYPPVSWTLGAILGLLLPWTWTPIAYTWLALTASGLAMHRLARAHATSAAALLASTLYLANPYMLFTAYERTAYAELLAAAWFPLLFHAILKPRPTIPAIAIPLALLWLTNAPAAVMGTYTLALLAAIRLVQEISQQSSYLRTGSTPSATRDSALPLRKLRHRLSSFHIAGGPALRLAGTTITGTLLGLALAAFYIVPAATERPLVQIGMVVLPGMRIDDNTLFHHTGATEDALAHDAVLHTASLVAILLLALSATAILLASLRRTEAKRISDSERISRHIAGETLFPLAILVITIAALLTPATLPIWHHAPELAFLQFPWRLLAVLATVLGLAAALALQPLRIMAVPQSLVALTLVAALTAAAAATFRQPCDPEDTVPARLAAFEHHTGSEPTDEYTPAPADNDSLQHANPPYWLSADPDATPPADQRPGPTPLDLSVNSVSPQYLILNLRQYPAWHVNLNGRELSPSMLIATPRADGLLHFPVPVGISQVHLSYSALPLEHVADASSALAALILATIGARKRLRRQPL